jgi:hypothetical protein
MALLWMSLPMVRQRASKDALLLRQDTIVYINIIITNTNIQLLCSNTTYEYPVSDSCTLQKVNSDSIYNLGLLLL